MCALEPMVSNMRSHCDEKLCWPQVEKAHVHQGTNIVPVNLCYQCSGKKKKKLMQIHVQEECSQHKE